jgi:hypothetical protein
MVRDCAPENLEIPGLRFAHPGMTSHYRKINPWRRNDPAMTAAALVRLSIGLITL